MTKMILAAVLATVAATQASSLHARASYEAGKYTESDRPSFSVTFVDDLVSAKLTTKGPEVQKTKSNPGFTPLSELALGAPPRPGRGARECFCFREGSLARGT